MKFLGNLFQHKPQTPFSSISGYDDVKNIINRVLSSEENFNLLLVGPPSSAKTQFLMEIMNFAKKNCVYFDASNTTNRILQVLEGEKPDIILLDELDKLPRVFAEKLLGFLQSGRVKVDQKNCQMDFELKACKVFGTANEIDRISKSLQSRFMKFYLSKYTEQEFLNVSEAVLPKLSPSLARYIGAKVYRNNGDIRVVINTGRLISKSDGPQEIEMIMNTLMKYSQAEGEKKK
jgi:replication-associated recombination protein RarA